MVDVLENKFLNALAIFWELRGRPVGLGRPLSVGVGLCQRSASTYTVDFAEDRIIDVVSGGLFSKKGGKGSAGAGATSAK